MRVDLYTKAVLTVIAACLVYLCFGRPPLLAGVQAQEGQFQRQLLQRVVIAGWLDADGVERRLPALPSNAPGPRPLPTFDAGPR